MERLKKFNEYLNNQKLLQLKDVYKLVSELGFHKSWDQWISNDNKSHRMKMWRSQSRKNIVIQLTKQATNWVDKDKIIINREHPDMEEAKSKIIEYFN